MYLDTFLTLKATQHKTYEFTRSKAPVDLLRPIYMAPPYPPTPKYELVKMYGPQHMEKYEKCEKTKNHENCKNIEMSWIFEKINFLKNIEKCKK